MGSVMLVSHRPDGQDHGEEGYGVSVADVHADPLRLPHIISDLA